VAEEKKRLFTGKAIPAPNALELETMDEREKFCRRDKYEDFHM
jgi:hypothetical protein